MGGKNWGKKKWEKFQFLGWKWENVTEESRKIIGKRGGCSQGWVGNGGRNSQFLKFILPKIHDS